MACRLSFFLSAEIAVSHPWLVYVWTPCVCGASPYLGAGSLCSRRRTSSTQPSLKLETRVVGRVVAIDGMSPWDPAWLPAVIPCFSYFRLLSKGDEASAMLPHSVGPALHMVHAHAHCLGELGYSSLCVFGVDCMYLFSASLTL